jgi:hypothetical protein
MRKCHSLLQSVTEFQSYLEDPQQNVKNSLLAAVTVFHGGEMKVVRLSLRKQPTIDKEAEQRYNTAVCSVVRILHAREKPNLLFHVTSLV